MRQNYISHSECRIFKSTISPEQIDETARVLVWWNKVVRNISWFKNS